MLRKLSIVAAGAVFADHPGAEPFAVLLIACLWLLVQMRARPYRFPVSVVTRERSRVFNVVFNVQVVLTLLG